MATTIYPYDNPDGDNVLVGTDGDDIFKAFKGNDLMFGGRGKDWFDGGPGSDTVDYSGPTATPGLAVAAFLANASANQGDAAGDGYQDVENLVGTMWNDRLYGNAFDNILEGLGGADEFDGGDGRDTVSYSRAPTSVNAWLDPTGWYLNWGHAQGDTYYAIENLIGSKFGDLLHGDRYDNVLTGGPGGDILDGRAGNDTASYATSPYRVGASLANPAGNSGEAAGDTYFLIENLAGSAYNDVLQGDATANILTGGPGADALDGGDGIDTASYRDAAARVATGLEYRTEYAGREEGDAKGDSFLSIENLTGSANWDLLWGNAQANVLSGLGGNDYLDGGAGSDSLLGGVGNDTLIGGPGWDTLYGNDVANGADGPQTTDTASYASASSGLTADLVRNGRIVFIGDPVSGWVQSWMNLDNTGDAAGDRYISIENLTGSFYSDRLLGDGGDNRIDGDPPIIGSVPVDPRNDYLDGRDGNDWLLGGEGNDTLVGGIGRDTLEGGAGADTYVYRAAAESVTSGDRDKINGFSSAQGDRIDLSAIDAKSATAGNDAFVFIGFRPDDYSGSAGELWVRGNIVFGDVDGIPGSDLEIELVGVNAELLTLASFAT